MHILRIVQGTFTGFLMFLVIQCYFFISQYDVSEGQKLIIVAVYIVFALLQPWLFLRGGMQDGKKYLAFMCGVAPVLFVLVTLDALLLHRGLAKDIDYSVMGILITGRRMFFFIVLPTVAMISGSYFLLRLAKLKDHL
jgi:fumarate reductase subunit C